MNMVTINFTYRNRADPITIVDNDIDPEAYRYANAVLPWHGLSKGGSAEVIRSRFSNKWCWLNPIRDL
jgi:hypothetical protein